MAEGDPFNLLPNVTIHFTEEQLSEITLWFDSNSLPSLKINEKEAINVITIEDLVKYLELKKFHRRNFHYPTYMEIMTEAENLKAGVTRMLTKEQFIYMLNKWIMLPNIKHEIQVAFSVFDTEKRNFLDVDEIRNIVTIYGDAFSEAEVRELLRDANVLGNGNVFYNDFIDSLFSLAPELYDLQVEYLYDNPDEDPSLPPEPVIVEEPITNLPPPPRPKSPPKDKKKKGKK